jgi:predicted RNase H-like HicB family nuclease
MIYPVYVHPGDEQHAHGITVPDFPGCFSAADEWEEIPAMVQEAIELYCEGEDMELPSPTPLEKLMDDDQYRGGVWLLVEIDTSRLDTRPVRLNISLPRGLVAQMDRYAKAHGMTRSGLIATAVRGELSGQQ